jgi:hypothetical protein
MQTKRFISITWLVVLLCWLLPALAAPSPHEIETLFKQGNLAGARAGIEQVIKEDPNSGKAYYLYAQILHAQRQDAQARQALSTAERLSPAMEFANPDYLRRLKAELNLPATGHPVAPPRSMGSGGLGIVLLLVLGGIVLVVIVRRRSKRQAQAANATARTEALKEAVSLLDFLKDTILKLETEKSALAADDPQRPILEQRIETLHKERQDLLKTVEDLQQQKQGRPIVYAADLQLLRERIGKEAAGIPDTPRRDAPLDPFAGVAMPPRPAAEPFPPAYPPQPPERIVVERNSSGPGFLTGILTGAALGSLLNRGHTEEGRHSQQPLPTQEPRDESRSGPHDLDVSGLDNDWSDSGSSSSDSSDLDAGGSDSWDS